MVRFCGLSLRSRGRLTTTDQQSTKQDQQPTKQDQQSTKQDQQSTKQDQKYEPFHCANDDSDDALEEPNLLKRLLNLDKQDEQGRVGPLVTIATAADTPHDEHEGHVQNAMESMKSYTKQYQEHTGDTVVAPDYEQRPCADFPNDPSIQEVVLSLKDDSPLFRNWGHTVSFQPSRTLVVKSISAVQKIVKWAAAKGKRVRVSGFRHSWSDIFGAGNDIIIMFLPYDSLVHIPYRSPPQSWMDSSELLGIHYVDEVAGRYAPTGHAFFRIMAGTTNDELREWSFKYKTWCIPFNVIMVEITMGGSNAPICHGSGLSTKTLSDLVVEVQYVDAKGDLQIVNDPEELKAAAGSFGLLGVVVSLTLQLDTMGVTDMMPVKQHVSLAIPPPKGYKIPAEVKKMMDEDGVTEAQFEAAREEFIRRIENDYYLEWFWFPYQRQCWVNTWSRRPASSSDVHIEDYPDNNNLIDGVTGQKIQATLAEAIVGFPPFQWLSGQLQASLMGKAAMFALPDVKEPSKAIKTYVSEALHFRRGIQNYRCLDCEWEIPMQTVAGKRDYDLIQRAWWDGISAVYADKNAPVRVALEMRITGDSDIILAPQRGNHNGTISIEVLTTLTTPEKTWRDFTQKITDIWTSYTDEHGKKLNVRPHWAKQWSGLKVHGKDVERYFKEDAYREAFVEFRKTFEAILAARNVTLAETLALFGTETMNRLIFGQ